MTTLNEGLPEGPLKAAVNRNSERKKAALGLPGDYRPQRHEWFREEDGMGVLRRWTAGTGVDPEHLQMAIEATTMWVLGQVVRGEALDVQVRTALIDMFMTGVFSAEEVARA